VEEQKSLTKSGKREMRRKTGSREGEKRKPYKILPLFHNPLTPCQIDQSIHSLTF